MKKYLCFITLLCLGLTVSAQNQFVLSGTLKGAPDNTYVKLNYTNEGGAFIQDSSLVIGSKFTFKGTVSEPTRSYIGVGRTFAEIYIEATEMEVSGTYDDLSRLQLKGSKTHNEYLALKLVTDSLSKAFDPVAQKIRAAQKAYDLAKKDNKPEMVIDSLNEVLTAAKKEREPFVARGEQIVREFVTTHPNSFISPVQLFVYVRQWPLQFVKTTFNGFAENVRNSSVGKNIKQELALIDATAESTAKNFSGVDLNGKALNLSNFNGKYVLLDFWGSWCIPCRAEMPHAIQTFKKYSPKRLEVIAIAADEKKEDWIRAIKKDGTSIWHNIMLTAAETQRPDKAVKQYNVHVFPTKVLIDRTGKILAVYEGSGSEELDKKLTEIFKEG